MPSHCPYCQAAWSRDSRFCVHCGNFSPPLIFTGLPALPVGRQKLLASPDHRAEPERPRVSLALDLAAPLLFRPTVSFWPLFAALALLAVVLLSADHLVVRGSRKAPSILADKAASPSRESPRAFPVFAAKPLTVALVCSQIGKPAVVGSPLILTASVATPGRSLTLALLSRKDGGCFTRFSLAEGRLCSAAWTPLAPGRYQFTASASDGHTRSAFARCLWITVGPLAPPEAVSDRMEAVRRGSSRRSHRRRLLAAVIHPDASSVVSPRPIPVSAVSPSLYHVVAASFPRSRNAIVLAKSFWSRDVKAAVRRLPDRQGKPVYAVETGGFHHTEEAQEAALTLQRSGYPAYSVAIR